jgi:PAS domain-containing protein
VSTAKAIQIILARQLASAVAMPILLVDAEGTLIFFNEQAEAILNQRFEETGEIPADEWNRLIAVTDEDHNPMSADDRPIRAALLDRRPLSKKIWIQSGDGPWRHLHVTSFPLIGDHDPSHSDADLDRLMAEAIDDAKPAYRVTPGREGMAFDI